MITQARFRQSDNRVVDGYLLKPISPQDIMPYLEKIGGH